MAGDKDPSDSEFAFLGRVILRTVKRDVLAIGIGAALGFGLAMIFGHSINLGLLCGAFLGLVLRMHLNPLFDYDDPPSKKE